MVESVSSGRVAHLDRVPASESGAHQDLRAPFNRVGRFWRRVDRSAGPDACWPWGGCHDGQGYGLVKFHGQLRRVPRLAYALANGIDWPPRDVQIRHRCDNPPCCNPRHLEPGTALDNARDRVMRGRSLIGERNPKAALNAGQVREILSRPHERHIWLAREFSVSPDVIYQIRSGRTWRHIPRGVSP